MCKCPQRLSFRTTTHQHKKNLFPQSWSREISSLQFSILVPLSSLVLWIESYSIYSLCFSSHPGLQNFLWQQKAQSPKQTENSSPKIKQLPVNSGIFYRNVPVRRYVTHSNTHTAQSKSYFRYNSCRAKTSKHHFSMVVHKEIDP